jgi:hypothetical protein
MDIEAEDWITRDEVPPLITLTALENLVTTIAEKAQDEKDTYKKTALVRAALAARRVISHLEEYQKGDPAYAQMTNIPNEPTLSE